MQKKTVLNKKTPEDPLAESWFNYLENDQKCAVPVGPQFQAEIPDSKDKESESLERMGTQIWPPTSKGKSPGRKIEGPIGKGRPEFCSCKFPGSDECITKHVEDEKTKLQSELGLVYWIWKFNEIGDGLSKLWTVEEKKEFESIVKANPVSRDRKSFIEAALEALPTQTKKSIINYYLSVYIPGKIRMKTRSGNGKGDTDDEEEETAEEEAETLTPKGSKKRSKPDSSSTSEVSNADKASRFLTGKR